MNTTGLDSRFKKDWHRNVVIVMKTKSSSLVWVGIGQALKGLSLVYNESLRPELGLKPIKGFYFDSVWPF